MSLSTTIKSIQDIMRKDAGTYGDAQRIEQLAWMFFLKIFDDSEAERELTEARDNLRKNGPRFGPPIARRPPRRQSARTLPNSD